MRRALTTIMLAGALIAAGRGLAAQGDGGFKLVPNWPKLPAGMYFGLKEAPPPPAERDAQAAARRASGRQGPSTGWRQAAAGNAMGPTNQPGISGLAIDQHDHIYVFNRGVKPVMVFDTEGNLILAGADQEINGKTINPSWQHSGGVDWDGNVYVIERDAHRIVKLSPKLDKFLLQLGTTNEKGNDATHLNLPSGIAILHNGNMIVTDGYGNNRVILFDKNGKFIKQVGERRRRTGRQGHRPGRVEPAAQDRGRCEREPLHHRPRRPSRRGVRQEPELHPRDQERLESVGHQHLAQGHRRHRLDRRSQGRARAALQPGRRQDHRGVGQAGLGPRASSTGSTASSSTRRARSTRPTPTVSGFRSSCAAARDERSTRRHVDRTSGPYLGTMQQRARSAQADRRAGVTSGARNWPDRSIVRLHASPCTSSTITRPSARWIVSGYGSITSP